MIQKTEIESLKEKIQEVQEQVRFLTDEKKESSRFYCEMIEKLKTDNENYMLEINALKNGNNSKAEMIASVV